MTKRGEEVRFGTTGQGIAICPEFPLRFLLCLLFLSATNVYAGELKASWYSVESLKREGTWKYSKGVMANGQQFSDDGLTCASCDFRLGTMLLVSSMGKSVRVKVTDRTNKRFKGKRIDLSKMAFSRISKLEKGLIPITVSQIKEGENDTDSETSGGPNDSTRTYRVKKCGKEVVKLLSRR
jgi:rare lipoprotein A (peptidoglycan hydrolase)